MSDRIRKYHECLVSVREIRGREVAINPWGGIFSMWLVWAAEWMAKGEREELDQATFDQEERELLPTLEAWGQWQAERESFLCLLQGEGWETLWMLVESFPELEDTVLLLTFIASSSKEQIVTFCKHYFKGDLPYMAVEWIKRYNIYLTKGGSDQMLWYQGGRGIAQGAQDILKGKGGHLRVRESLLEAADRRMEQHIKDLLAGRTWRPPKDVADMPPQRISSLDETIEILSTDDDPEYATRHEIVGRLDPDILELPSWLWLEEILRSLSSEQQRLAQDVLFTPKTYREIAEQETITDDALRQRISRLTRMIKTAFKSDRLPEKRKRGRPRKKRD